MNDAGIQLLQVNETRLMGLLFCLYLAASVLQNFAFMRRSYSIHHGLWQVGYVLRLTLRPPAVPARIFPVLLLAFAASLIAYGLMAQRIWGLAALALYLLTIPSIRTMHLIHQKSNLCPIVLTILLISSEYHSPLFYVDRASSGDAVSWPLICIRALIASVYVATSTHKLITTGWKWTTGPVLQWYLLEHYLWGGFTRAVPLMQNLLLLRLFSTITVLTQLTAPLIILGGWVPAVHGLFALGFHLSTHFFMGINFLAFFGPVMASSALSYPLATLAEAHLSVGTIETLFGPLSASASSAAWQVVLMALLPLLLIYSQFSWQIGFPFGPVKLFSADYSDFKHVAVLHLELGDASGEYRPWRPFEYYDVRDCSHFGYDRAMRTVGLSPKFSARFRQFYWPIIQRDDPKVAATLRSIRLHLRHAVWDGDIPVGYDDYAIAMIHVDGQRCSDIQTIPRLHLRSHRFRTFDRNRLLRKFRRPPTDMRGVEHA